MSSRNVPLTDKGLHAILELLELLRAVDPEMPMGAARTLLLVASEEGMSVADLHRRGGMALSSASRYHQYLGDEDRHGRPGLGLVVVYPSLEDSRKKTIRLTPRDRQLVANLSTAVGKAQRAA